MLFCSLSRVNVSTGFWRLVSLTIEKFLLTGTDAEIENSPSFKSKLFLCQLICFGVGCNIKLALNSGQMELANVHLLSGLWSNLNIFLYTFN